MADYNLGTAEGTIRIGYDGKGINQAGKGMDDLETRARKVQQGFNSVATTTGIATVAIAGGIAFAVNAAIDFEKRISAIGAVSGASAAQMEILRQKALQLGADTAFSASEAALAMEELVKAGLSVDEVLNGAADATVALAAAGEVALPEAAAIASNAMNQFKLAAEDLPRIADLIAGAANASAIDVGDFGFSLSQAGAVANLVGVNFEDLAAAIALMGNQGIKGSDAGTSLKTMLQNLQPTTKRQIELMKELGILTEDGTNKFFDQHGQLKSLSEVAGILNNALKGMTDAQKTMALETIFGSDAIRAAAVLATEGADGFNEMAAAMAEVTAQEVAAKRLDNVAGAIDQLKGSAETAAIAFGSALLPVIKRVTEFITLLVNKFSALDPKWQKLIAFAAVAAAALLGLIAAIATVGAVVAGLAASLVAVKFAAIIGGIIALVIAIAAAVKVAYDRSAEFRGVLQKLGAVAVAIFSAIASVVKPVVAFFRDQLIPAVREISQNLQKNLAPAFKAIGDFIQTRVLPGVERLREAFMKVLPTLLAVGSAILSVAKFIGNALGKALGFIIPILANVLGPVFSVLIDIIAGVIEFIPKLISGFKTFIDILITVGKWIGIAIIAPFYLIYQVGKWVFEQLLAVAKVFVDAFVAVWEFIEPVVSAVFGAVAAVIGAAFDVISTLFGVFWAGIKLIWDLIWKYMIGPVVAGFKVIMGAIGAAMKWIGDRIAESWAEVKAIWDKIYAWVVEPIIKAFGVVKDWITERMAAARDYIKDVWAKIVAYFTNARDKLIGIINNFSQIVTKVRDFFNQMKDAAIAKATELVNWVKALPGRILSALGNIGSALYNAGRSLIQGFWDGIKSIWNSMVGWVEDKMAGLRGLWPFSPAKYGPFSGRGWVLYSGRALMTGFAEGMDDRVGKVQASAKRALAGVAASLPTDFSATVAASQSTTGLVAGFGASGSTPSDAATTGNTTVHNEINLNVPLEDLRSIKDVQDLLDFIDRLRNDSRRGIEVPV